MNKVLNSISHRLRPIIFQYRKRKIKENFSLDNDQLVDGIENLLFDTLEIHKKIVIKDESWDQIKNIGLYMWNDLFKNKYLQLELPINNTNLGSESITPKVIFKNSTILCKSKNLNNDWIFLHLPKILEPRFAVEFQASITNANSEFQFAFNYKSIGNRYRFNLKNNNILSFEVVQNGFFYNDIVQVPFSLQLNKEYNFRIIIEENNFHYLVDNTAVLSVKQKKSLIEKGELGWILWDSHKSNINTTYKNIRIFKS